MKEIRELNPTALWGHFADMLAIPHTSYHEESLKTHIKSFAERIGVEAQEDRAGNLILRKGASVGMEGVQGVILQAHLDMVPQSVSGEFDFLSEPISAYVDGDYIRARETTLGADNGLGVAAAMAILEDEELSHGALEVLLTVSEESGMDGAFGLEEGSLQGDILLNLDTEDEGEFCVGCAGGLDLIATFGYEMEQTPRSGYVARRLSISGLRGGHSGLEIAGQRGNANKLLFRLLRLSKLDLLLCSLSGGTLRNAIPRYASVDLLIAEDEVMDFEMQIAKYKGVIEAEYRYTESSIELSLEEIEYPEEMIPEEAASCIVWSVAGCFDGVYRRDVKGAVQSSSNLAIVRSRSGETKVELLLRSSVESEKMALADTIASIFELAEAEVVCEGGYPAWQPRFESPLLDRVQGIYKELFSRDGVVRVIHAGLECGVIGSTYPNLDMISFGPTIHSPHSPAECAEVATVERFYKLLREIIETTPAK